ncbi:cell division cycle 2 [Sporothrix brasiliensis 5110]|uniref:cyclin-dependent kinase n=1 Tax=Sporothrix brasiliensis 5110 TaxID=1398154 RepID=A0A0C2IX60_9PEZI|nr:cell division cycle 2 [Sporothrix brasiliensis 5110]KIH93691.1 cell division cycle 2 [Sporothrix brasiliensis 5110]
MASAAKSRWADAEEDAAFEEKRRRDKEKKEEKKRLKAIERAKKEAAEAARKAVAAQSQQDDDTDDGVDGDGRPLKRRKYTPERDDVRRAPPPRGGRKERSDITAAPEGRLLRLSGGALPDPCRSVERYDKLNDIEEGAYGWVARAKDRATGEVVALKRLKLDPHDRSGVPVTGLREIQLLRDCAHRNVVALREVVVGERRPIDNILLVLEFVEHDVKSILEDMPQPFLASEVKTLLRQLAAGVAYLHGRWILHRDLKTSNLLLNNRGQLKIADFGMARYYSEEAATPSSSSSSSSSAGCHLTPLVVTLWYRAPELLLGARRYGRAVDLWSVGCIFGELLTREPLLQGKNEVDELKRIFDLCGVPTDATWPGFRRLPNARALRLPSSPSTTATATATTTTAAIRAKFPLLTTAGCHLLSSLLSLDPAKRPTADEMLDHEYFRQDPRAKQEAMFPTFPSKAGQERRRRRDTPNAPQRGAAVADLGAVDFTGIFGRRDKEERGAGFSLRMV